MPVLTIDLINSFNPAQIEVIKHKDGPLLILAAAGSGKTKCVIYRTAWLIHEHKIAPWNILIVTFTNKAAGELKERLENLLSYPVKSLWVGTFHSVCSRILRLESKYHPFSSNFSIYDEDDQRALLKKIYKTMNIDNQKYPLSRVMYLISKCKNMLQLPEDLEIDKKNWIESRDYYAIFISIYRAYQQQLIINKAMDFDDILLWTAKLFENNIPILEKYRKQFQYVMIDEYQDTNYAQFKIMHQIASIHQNICVVGDDDQAIYSWRGASIRNILEFEKDYVNVRKIRLEQNYRSTTAILDVANSLINHNQKRHNKILWSELGTGYKPRLLAFEDDNDEAQSVVGKISELHNTGIEWQQCAILYRTNAQSRVFEYACIESKVPYSIIGSLLFYHRKEIKDILAYLKLISNLRDSESLLRIINEPTRGIGITTISKLSDYSSVHNITLFKAISQAHKINTLKKNSIKKLESFYSFISDMILLSTKKPVLVLVKTIIEETKWVDAYKSSQDPKEISRAENLLEFVASVSDFTDKFLSDFKAQPLLSDYLPFVTLQSDIDQLSSDKNTIRLMTLHNAKGLEFEYLFIVGLEQELLPHRMSMGSKDEIEEERRLLYVGITRAKTMLQLSYVKLRRLYDSYYYAQPSMFLYEIESNLIDIDGSVATLIKQPTHKKSMNTKSFVSKNMKAYRIGQKVHHIDYGDGLVLRVDGEGLYARVTVSFNNGKLAKIIGTFLQFKD